VENKTIPAIIIGIKVLGEDRYLDNIYDNILIEYRDEFSVINMEKLLFIIAVANRKSVFTRFIIRVNRAPILNKETQGSTK